jgi:hypothetical protein
MTELRTALEGLVAAGKTEALGGVDFAGVFDLGTGLRYGLVLLPEGDVGWAVVDGARLVKFAPETAAFFVEVLEHSRREVDDRIEREAAQRGLPAEPTLFSFPSVALVRAIAATRAPHFCRMALVWLLPTELRELRGDIQALARDEECPEELRDLAAHLVVPER